MFGLAGEGFSMQRSATTYAPHDASPTSQPKSPLRLPAAIYQELRKVAQRFMRREAAGHTLQPTALVNEAFVRMAAHEGLASCGQTHVRAMFAQAMHRILVDHARRRSARKRGGERIRVALDEKLLPADSEHDLLD